MPLITHPSCGAAPDDDGPRPRLTWAGVRAALEAWDAGRVVTVRP